MVRNITKKIGRKASAQWRTAWAMLDEAHRDAIVAFMVAADADVAAVALMV